MSEQKTPEELAAAYAIGALDAEELAQYEAWLLEAPDAAADAATYAQVATALGLAAEPVTPSADLRSRVLAQVAGTPQLPAQAKPATVAEPVEAPTSAEPVEARQTPAERRARSRWSRPGTILVAAAASVLLFVGGGVVGSLIGQNEFAVEQATALAQLQTAADSQQTVSEMEGGGQATLIWSEEQGRSAILVDEMPALPDGQTYQLWYIRGETPIADATFQPAEQGKTWRVLDGTMAAGDAVGVTIEPEGGSEKPSSTPLVVITSA